MKFDSILKDQWQYLRNSIVWLDYSTSFDTIEIQGADNTELFLQGEDAANVLDKARDLAENRFIDETFEDCLILCLYNYVDLLGA